MKTTPRLVVFASLLLACPCGGWAAAAASEAAPPSAATVGLSAADRTVLESGLKRVEQKLSQLREQPRADLGHGDGISDAELFLKAVTWGLRYDTDKITASDVALLKKAVRRADERIDALSAGHTPWMKKKGRVLRGFVSAIDGSVQSYGVIIPNGYDGLPELARNSCSSRVT